MLSLQRLGLQAPGMLIFPASIIYSACPTYRRHHFSSSFTLSAFLLSVCSQVECLSFIAGRYLVFNFHSQYIP